MMRLDNRSTDGLGNRNVTPQARPDIKYYYDFGTGSLGHEMVVAELARMLQGD